MEHSLVLPRTTYKLTKVNAAPAAGNANVSANAAFLSAQSAKVQLLFRIFQFALESFHTVTRLLESSNQDHPFQDRVYQFPNNPKSAFIAPLASEIAPLKDFLTAFNAAAYNLYQDARIHYNTTDTMERSMYYTSVPINTENDAEDYMLLSHLKTKQACLSDLVKNVTQTFQKHLA